MLTTSDLPLKEITKSSNGNTETLIAEIPTINTSLIVFYTPSGENFSEDKFRDSMKVIRKYLNEKTKTAPEQKFLMLGDFNLPSEIVRWEKSNKGVLLVNGFVS